MFAQPVRIAYEDVEKVKAGTSADAASVKRGLKRAVAAGAVVCAVILVIVLL